MGDSHYQWQVYLPGLLRERTNSSVAPYLLFLDNTRISIPYTKYMTVSLAMVQSIQHQLVLRISSPSSRTWLHNSTTTLMNVRRWSGNIYPILEDYGEFHVPRFHLGTSHISCRGVVLSSTTQSDRITREVPLQYASSHHHHMVNGRL